MQGSLGEPGSPKFGRPAFIRVKINPRIRIAARTSPVEVRGVGWDTACRQIVETRPLQKTREAGVPWPPGLRSPDDEPAATRHERGYFLHASLVFGDNCE